MISDLKSQLQRDIDLKSEKFQTSSKLRHWEAVRADDHRLCTQYPPAVEIVVCSAVHGFI